MCGQLVPSSLLENEVQYLCRFVPLEFLVLTVRKYSALSLRPLPKRVVFVMFGPIAAVADVLWGSFRE